MEQANTRHWKLNLAMMWFSQLMVMTGFSAVVPFIPLFFKKIGIVDEGECGVYVSLFAFFGTLAYAVFLPIWGTLSDRFGVKIMLLRGTFLTAFIFPFMGYVENAWLLIALRFVTAACAGTTAASQTMIAKNTPDNRIGLAMGIFSTAFWCGAMLGNVAGGLVVHYFGFTNAFWFCGILYFIGGISVVFSREDFKPAAKQNMIKKIRVKPAIPLMPVFTVSVWLILVMFMCNAFVRTFESNYMPMLVDQITADPAYWTGIISAFASCGALLSGIIFGYLADKISPNKLIVPALAITSVTLLIQAHTDDLLTFGVARTAMFIFGGGLAPVYQKVLSNITPRRKRGQVFGWTSTFNGVGNMASTLVAGGILYITSTRGVFYTAAVLTLLLIPLLVVMLNRVMQHSGLHRKSKKSI